MNQIIKRLFVLVFITGVLVLSSCSAGETESQVDESEHVSEESAEKEEQETADKEGEAEAKSYPRLEEAPLPPQTIEEALAYPTGPLAGKIFAGHEALFLHTYKEELPPLDDNFTEEEITAYFNAFLSLVFENFPSPENLIQDLQFQMFGSSDTDERLQFKENFNVKIILDVSGSMADEIDGKRMIDIAKDSIRKFSSALPKQANVGLRVYGHVYGKEASCRETELVYELQPYDSSKLESALAQFEPTGWTPIALALEDAMDDFQAYPGEDNTNIIFLVSDGEETCGGDPVAVAKKLAESEIQPIINVIGFNVEADVQAQLEEIAQAANGAFYLATNEEELYNQFRKTEEMAQKWKEWREGAVADVTEQMEKMSDTIWDFADEWYERFDRMNSNMSNVTRALENEGYISFEAKKELDGRILDFSSDLNIEISRMHTELHMINHQNYGETVREIERIFSENIE
ncbi:Ca-activated chloride channel family protein [Caldalkalibacillus uzonensis]|uniref:Ca-activated chloride channel family protein n=1 Tax=Caldalkalibacillus uzonensis TaxID=353224 RepID=A0ABU0CN78_9BACI|nr:VWA domain-containing protein [Caldalkalibacillus uzonensis]MDQ0337868.1 Ca-activated chloride channel family protein [Caldalkalibacillus uzonensis]